MNEFLVVWFVGYVLSAILLFLYFRHLNEDLTLGSFLQIIILSIFSWLIVVTIILMSWDVVILKRRGTRKERDEESEFNA